MERPTIDFDFIMGQDDIFRSIGEYLNVHDHATRMMVLNKDFHEKYERTKFLNLCEILKESDCSLLYKIYKDKKKELGIKNWKQYFGFMKYDLFLGTTNYLLLCQANNTLIATFEKFNLDDACHLKETFEEIALKDKKEQLGAYFRFFFYTFRINFLFSRSLENE